MPEIEIDGKKYITLDINIDKNIPVHEFLINIFSGKYNEYDTKKND